IYLKSDLAWDDVQVRRLARDLGVVQRISVAINEIEGSDDLQEFLLERIFEIVPADRAAILLATIDEKSFLASPVSKQKFAADAPIRVSRTIAQKVLTSGQAILRNDLLDDPNKTDSVAMLRIRSVLCVPLSCISHRIGVLYLDATQPGVRFDERHLELVTV